MTLKSLTLHLMVDTLTMVAHPDLLAILEPQIAILQGLEVPHPAATLELAATILQGRLVVKVLILVAVPLHCTIILQLIIMHFIPPASPPALVPPPLPPPTCLLV